MCLGLDFGALQIRYVFKTRMESLLCSKELTFLMQFFEQ